MIRWYADDAELNSIYYSEIPDIRLFGGIVIRQEDERGLCSDFNKLKSRISPDFHFPIKWNFKDLKKFFNQHDRIELYEEILHQSKEIRENVFTLISSSKIKIITAIIKSHGIRREAIKRNKDRLAGYVFLNGLQRFGYYIQRHRINESVEVIIDWPAAGNAKPFTEEYYCAYHYGKAAESERDYYCGRPLDLGFHEAVRFSKMKQCPLLQISDLIVGAMRNLVDVAMGNDNDTFGLDMLKIVLDNFYGAPDNIVGRGICVSPTNSELRYKIAETVNDRLVENVFPF